MQPPPTTPRYTYADYAALEEGAPYQLIGGQLVQEPAPTPFHQHLVLELAVALRRYVKQHGSGRVFIAPIDVVLSDVEVYQPDVVFVAARSSADVTEHHIEGAPDLIVEVLSPSTGYYDLTHKRTVYAERGVQEYWLVDPMPQTIQVLRNTGGRFEPIAEARATGEVQSALLGGFAVTLDAVFTW